MAVVNMMAYLRSENARLEHEVACLVDENQELRDEAQMNSEEAEEVFGEIAVDLHRIGVHLIGTSDYIERATRRSKA